MSVERAYMLGEKSKGSGEGDRVSVQLSGEVTGVDDPTVVSRDPELSRKAGR